MQEPTAQNFVLKVCPLGFGERAVQTLSAFFERQLAGSSQLVDEASADVVLIDLDLHGANVHLDRQVQERPERPLILLSLNELAAEIPGGVLVRKPVKIDVLAGVLNDLAARLSSPRHECSFSAASEPVLKARAARQKGGGAVTAEVRDSDQIVQSLHSRESYFYIGSMPDVDLRNESDRRKIFYDPGQFLQGFVQKALRNGIENGVVVRISAPAFGSVTVYPFAGKVFTRTPAPALCAAARIPLREKDVVVELCRDQPHYPAEDEALEAVGPFLWKLALWASRGRLPTGTPTDAPVALKRWPNLTRLLVPPHATRIAGLWMRSPLSLAESALVLGLPQRFVFAFFSASAALELARAEEGRQPVRAKEIAQAPVIPEEKRSIFRLFLNKLIGVRNG